MRARDRLLAQIDLLDYDAYAAPHYAGFESWEAALAAIEREAVQALGAPVRALPQPVLGLKGGVDRQAVLDLIEEAFRD